MCYDTANNNEQTPAAGRGCTPAGGAPAAQGGQCGGLRRFPPPTGGASSIQAIPLAARGRTAFINSFPIPRTTTLVAGCYGCRNGHRCAQPVGTGGARRRVLLAHGRLAGMDIFQTPRGI